MPVINSMLALVFVKSKSQLLKYLPSIAQHGKSTQTEKDSP